MKKIKKFVSLTLVIAMLCACTAHAFAVESNAVSPDEKISEELKQKMDDSSDEELIPVWIWYKDIDQDRADNITEEKIGFSATDCSVIDKTISIDKYGTLFDKASFEKSNLNEYLEITKQARRIEGTRSQNYIESRRKISSEMYKESGNNIILETGISDDKVLFRSEFAPIIIAELTQEEITKISKNILIDSISKYSLDCDNVYEEESDSSNTPALRDSTPSTFEVMTRSMGLEEVYDKLDLTGEGTKIGLIEGDLPGIITDDNYTYSTYEFDSDNLLNIVYDYETDYDNIDSIVGSEIENFDGDGPLKVVVIIDSDYSDWTYIQPVDDGDLPHPHGHTNNTTRIMVGDQTGFAKGATVYATLNGGHGANHGVDLLVNTEALIKCGITILEVNIEQPYGNSSPDNFANSLKYNDHLVCNHHIALVMPAGNWCEDTTYGNWVNPLALSYNTIAVGAYNTTYNSNDGIISENRENFKWQNSQNGLQYCEKPDVILPDNWGSIGTSNSSPAMAAIIALMYELKPSIKLMPHVTKAIILASCHRKADPCNEQNATDVIEDIFDGITERQGAGIPDVWVISQILLQQTYMSGSINSGSTIYFNINMSPYQNYNLNCSISWLRQTSATNLHFNFNDITGYEMPDLNLYLVNDNTIKSELDCSSTEMCYFSTNNMTSPYRFRVENNDNVACLLACAWSTSDREKELHHIEMSGKPAVGKILSVKGYCNDGTQAPANSLNYQWKRSSDGTTWSNISGATSSSYTLTSSDILNYIKCTATPNNTSIVTSTSKSDSTNLKIIRFGDVNFDGLVTNTDATLVQQHISHMITLNDDALRAADVDANNLINVGDSTMISMYVDGMITQFPAEA